MSVKQMTTEQIRDDLEVITMTWPEGIPAEQNDRVNALKGELKRRGETVAARPPARRAPPRPDVNDMTRDALEKELRELSEASSQDEDAQTRFANVRYALRNRLRNGEVDAPPAKRAASLPPRALELPDDDEIKQYRKVTKSAAAPMPRTTSTVVDDDDIRVVDDDDDAQRMMPRRTANAVAAATTTRDIRRRGKPVTKQAPTSVNGFTAAAVIGAGGQVGVDFEFERRTPTGVVCVARHFTADEWDAFVTMATAVHDQVYQANARDDNGDNDD